MKEEFKRRILKESEMKENLTVTLHLNMYITYGEDQRI